MIDTETSKFVLIKKALTRSLPMVGVGLLTALSAGCGNGVTSSGPASAGPALSPPVVASGSAEPTLSTSAGSPSTSGSTSGSEASATATTATAARSTASGAGPSSAGSNPTKSGHGGSGGSTAATQSSSKPSSGRSGRPTCTQSGLKFSVKAADGGGAAGSSYVLLTFTNTTGADCWLYGYPGVSFVGYDNGTQLGAAAKRSTNTTARSVELSPGHSTTSLLQIINAGNFGATACAPTTANGFRVYPPASTRAAYVPFKTQACQRSGARQLTISPVGTSG